jgi:hypothetical protein
MNDILLANAVRFLSDPTVRSSPGERQLSFLKAKGLNEDEIEEAFRRAGLPHPQLSSPSNYQASYPATTSIPPSQDNYNNNCKDASYPYHGDLYGTTTGQPPEQLYQLARTSTVARWLLLLALIGSAMAVLIRSLPRPIYDKLHSMVLNFFSRRSKQEPDKLDEMSRQLEKVALLVEGLQKRQMQIEGEMVSWRYQRRFEDCRDEDDDEQGPQTMH